MLHIVQVVLSGTAETPKAYFDERTAQAAFVNCAKKYWAQAYAAYCGQNGIDSACFSSAQDFVANFDLADRSRIHYWSVTPEDAVTDAASGMQADLEALQESRERIDRLIQDEQQASSTVRNELTELLEDSVETTGDVTFATAQPASESDRPGRPTAAERSSPPTPAEAPQPPVDTYNSKEWKEYVEAIKNMCGGNRSEFHLLTRYDWRQAVYSGQTSAEYWEWVATMIDHYIEKAQQAGYSVIKDRDKPGCYQFMTPNGIVSDISSEAEGEAWCRAGLHQEGK